MGKPSKQDKAAIRQALDHARALSEDIQALQKADNRRLRLYARGLVLPAEKVATTLRLMVDHMKEIDWG